MEQVGTMQVISGGIGVQTPTASPQAARMQ
jgi:hypothetical protein